MHKIRKMLCLALLAGIGILCADTDMEGGASVGEPRNSYKDRRQRDRVPNIGDVLIGRDGEWLLGFTEFLRSGEVRYWLVVSDEDECLSDFLQQPPLQDLLLVRYNGTTQTMFTEGNVPVASYPEDHFDRVELWHGIRGAFTKGGREKERCYLLILAEVTAKEAFGGDQCGCKTGGNGCLCA